jgi:hypothetical protein
MHGRLDNADDVAWLLAWLASSCGESIEFAADPFLQGPEFETRGRELLLSPGIWRRLDGNENYRCSAGVPASWWVAESN